ncbi:hypothetical protein [Bartonella sp. HY038]|uniref:hypothetical protein n=1 Tax=Bartonella sp. HY038 TaxID=2759660 RepID=UPI0015FAC942|nr:hypothetical protein [Bartonella sp. HY038]
MKNSPVNNISIDVELLQKIEKIAAIKNCSVDELIYDALSAFIALNIEAEGSRESIMRAYQESHKKYASLYERLAQ